MAKLMNDVYRALQQQLGLISRSSTDYLKAVAELSKSTSPVAALQRSLAERFTSNRDLFGNTAAILSQSRLISDATSNFRDLAVVNANLTSLVSSANIVDSSLSKVFADHNALRSSISSIAMEPSVSHLLSSVDTTRLLHTSLSAQYRLLSLETASFGSLIGASTLFANDLSSTLGKFTSSYRDLVECIPTIPESQVPFITKYSPIEYSLELEVLEQISTDEPSEEDVELPEVDEELALFDDKLLILINGARQSLTSDNPDKIRHVTTSIRELFTHIIHGLAPDAEIMLWSRDSADYCNGKPTRRARLLYICRNFACGPLVKFVEDDVRAVLTLVDSLNAGTHVVQSKLTEIQLAAIVYRMESLALYLLKVSKGG
ncbi:MAG: hypothetical protein V4719_19075 [Planctomycetota bacterium]